MYVLYIKKISPYMYSSTKNNHTTKIKSNQVLHNTYARPNPATTETLDKLNGPKAHLHRGLRHQQMSLSRHLNRRAGFWNQRGTIFHPGQLSCWSTWGSQTPHRHLSVQFHGRGHRWGHKLLAEICK